MSRLSSTILSKEFLQNKYIVEAKSMQAIAKEMGCSLNRVDYWMRKYGIQRRSRSDANYALYNPYGDPFLIKDHLSAQERELFGLGIDLYWGEGTKASKNAVRIGNSDPGVIKKFMEFLDTIYGVSKSQLKFGMQLFSDVPEEKALSYWCQN